MKKIISIVLLTGWLMSSANALIGCSGCCCGLKMKISSEKNYSKPAKLCGMTNCRGILFESSKDPVILCGQDVLREISHTQLFEIVAVSDREALLSFLDSFKVNQHFDKIPIHELPQFLKFNHFLI